MAVAVAELPELVWRVLPDRRSHGQRAADASIEAGDPQDPDERLAFDLCALGDELIESFRGKKRGLKCPVHDENGKPKTCPVCALSIFRRGKK